MHAAFILSFQDLGKDLEKTTFLSVEEFFLKICRGFVEDLQERCKVFLS